MVTIKTREMKWVAVSLASSMVLLTGCTASQDAGPAATASGGVHSEQADQPVAAAAPPELTTETDWEAVADTLESEGKLSGETVYRVTFPRRDLNVISEGVAIEPGLALGSYAAFSRYPDGTTMVMGDLVVTEDELPKVTDALQRNGLGQTAVHKHLLEHSPQVWWVHFHGTNEDAAQLATGVRAALDETATPPAEPAASAEPGIDLDTAGIDAALGTEGRNDGGIYKFSFARADEVTMDDRVLEPAMGVTTAINFQPTGGGKAAINGDFAMTHEEVQPVIQALRAGGIEIVELHNHVLEDEPRLFYLHFWANDDAVQLAQALSEAVKAHDVKPAG
ncbi:DUF1259 domain-containing protein [Arthrobacter sp. CAL618]|uniref:DUF1259 domain-containing protein n=1 Tax=Arthrobacter sp. CAL618 TaxID=1055770 RepID=UPI00040D8EA1|nr:DUF1259 domain-containing protein [Arthrobacter sp. CAL618]